MNKLSTFTKNAQKALKKHSPEILTAIGIGGMIGTTIMAVKATPKALMLIEDKKFEEQAEELTPIEVVKTCWKCYVPAAVTGVMSVVCFVGASSINTRRNAALITAYTLSESALREYKEKVVETIGEKKERVVRDAIAKDKIDSQPVSKSNVVVTGKGNTLCFDVMSGRYFESDIDKLKKIQNELNRTMLQEDYISLNEFYHEIGLDDIPIGEDMGWNINNKYMELDFSSQLTDDGRPCLVVGHYNPPQYNYAR